MHFHDRVAHILATVNDKPTNTTENEDVEADDFDLESIVTSVRNARY